MWDASIPEYANKDCKFDCSTLDSVLIENYRDENDKEITLFNLATLHSSLERAGSKLAFKIWRVSDTCLGFMELRMVWAVWGWRIHVGGMCQFEIIGLERPKVNGCSAFLTW